MLHFLNVYIFLTIFLYFIVTLKTNDDFNDYIECEEEVFSHMKQNVKKEHRRLYANHHKLNGFFGRLSGTFCETIAKCPDPFVKETEILPPERRLWPTSCSDALKPNMSDGVYILEIPNSNLSMFHAWCMADQSNGLPWTVLLKRENGNFDFYREWNLYKYGFGALSGEHWLGLEALHEMTYFERHELRIDLRSNNSSVTLLFSNFIVGPSDSGYKIQALQESTKTGFEKDFFGHIGTNFATKDKDTMATWAQVYRGAWWFAGGTKNDLKNNIHLCGPYKNYPRMFWKSFNDKFGDITYALMAIRPAVDKKNKILN